MTKKKRYKVLTHFYLLLSIYLFGIAMYIEFLNHKAGGILPNREYRNNDPAQGRIEWRVAITGNLKGLGTAAENEANELSSHVISNKDQLERDQLARANNRLRSTVINFGLPQYPLLLLSGVVFMSCLILRSSANTKTAIYILSGCFSLNLISIALLLIRDYFGSLGW